MPQSKSAELGTRTQTSEVNNKCEVQRLGGHAYLSLPTAPFLWPHSLIHRPPLGLGFLLRKRGRAACWVGLVSRRDREEEHRTLSGRAGSGHELWRATGGRVRGARGARMRRQRNECSSALSMSGPRRHFSPRL